MLIAAKILLVVVNVVCLVLVLFQLPGNWLMVLTTGLMAWWQWDEGVFSVPLLVAIVVLAVVGEVVELAAGALGAKKAGGTKWGAIGALFGGMPGAVLGTILIPVPILGTLFGASAGAYAGAWLLERHVAKRDHDEARRSGIGAGMGVLVGTVTKFSIGITIWVTVFVAAFV